MTGLTRNECLAAADALEAMVHMVDDSAAAEVLAHHADLWRSQALDVPLIGEPAATAADYVERMAADHEGAAVHLLASPHRGTGIAQDEARIRRDVAENLRHLATWLRSQPPAIDEAHLARQAAWSERTFGPGPRTAGVVDHVRKELHEVLLAAGEHEVLAEWVDVVILALDGAWRTGASPAQVIAAIRSKQHRNENRTWPDWRTADPDKAIEHVRTAVTAAPKRVQRSRAKGWRMPEGTTYVGRPGVFGNPFRVGDTLWVWRPRGWERVDVDSLEDAVQLFRDWASAPWQTGGLRVREREHRHLIAFLPTLRGRDLACWCPLDEPCHADVLLELANGTVPDATLTTDPEATDADD